MDSTIAGFDSSVPERRLVFLVGAARSGTTWLQLMLGSTEQVVTVQETDLFTQYLSSVFATWDRLKRDEPNRGLTPIMDESTFLSLVRGFTDGVNAKILAIKPGASVILEKTPEHVRFWREIRRIYPDAYFLHLVRDPRGVTASMRAAKGTWARSWALASVVDNSLLWRKCVLEGRSISKATERVIEVRYEDLKSNCAVELHRIFAWMNVDVSPERCAEIAERYQIDQLQKGSVEGASWDLSKDPKGFYRQGEADSWQRELSPGQIELIEYITSDLMDYYRYARAKRPNKLVMLARLKLDVIRAAMQWRVKRVIDTLLPKL